MGRKRHPPEDDIIAMARELRPVMKAGDTIYPFIRRNQEQLLKLAAEESWKTLARVVTTLGITYSSGKPWTERSIANVFDRAIKESKRRRATRQAGASAKEPEHPPTVGPAKPRGVSVEEPSHRHMRAPTYEAMPDARPAPERHFVFKNTPRIGPPAAPSDEDIARRDALEARLFGKREE